MSKFQQQKLSKETIRRFKLQNLTSQNHAGDQTETPVRDRTINTQQFPRKPMLGSVDMHRRVKLLLRTSLATDKQQALPYTSSGASTGRNGDASSSRNTCARLQALGTYTLEVLCLIRMRVSPPTQKQNTILFK